MAILSTTLPAWSETTLLLLGHGSTTNQESKIPTLRHADAIRKAGHFAHVATAFWKEQPYFSEVLATLPTESVFIVPNFISEGYYTREIIPREFRMTGRVSRTEGKTLLYCDPVGSHPSMTRALLRQVDEILGDAEVDRSSLDLILVGHGTSRNRMSTEMIKKQVERIRTSAPFAYCTDAYMEEAPFIADWDQLTPSDRVVVVPFFIADGLHSYEDIPQLMGLVEEEAVDTEFNVPARLRGKTLWYARAIGNQSALTEVILDLVRGFSPDTPFCTSCPGAKAGIL